MKCCFESFHSWLAVCPVCACENTIPKAFVASTLLTVSVADWLFIKSYQNKKVFKSTHWLLKQGSLLNTVKPAKHRCVRSWQTGNKHMP